MGMSAVAGSLLGFVFTLCGYPWTVKLRWSVQVSFLCLAAAVSAQLVGKCVPQGPVPSLGGTRKHRAERGQGMQLLCVQSLACVEKGHKGDLFRQNETMRLKKCQQEPGEAVMAAATTVLLSGQAVASDWRGAGRQGGIAGSRARRAAPLLVCLVQMVPVPPDLKGFTVARTE